jgi:hypothetical protein
MSKHLRDRSRWGPSLSINYDVEERAAI